MIIRREQMETVAAHRRWEECQFLHGFLRAEIGHEIAGMSDEELYAHCHESLEIGAELGLSDRRSMAFLAVARALIHPRFHEHPWLQSLLSDPGVPPERRIENLLAGSTALDWREAAHPGRARTRP